MMESNLQTTSHGGYRRSQSLRHKMNTCIAALVANDACQRNWMLRLGTQPIQPRQGTRLRTCRTSTPRRIISARWKATRLCLADVYRLKDGLDWLFEKKARKGRQVISSEDVIQCALQCSAKLGHRAHGITFFK